VIPRKITDDKYIFIYLGVVGWPLLTFIIGSSSVFLKKNSDMCCLRACIYGLGYLRQPFSFPSPLSHSELWWVTWAGKTTSCHIITLACLSGAIHGLLNVKQCQDFSY